MFPRISQPTDDELFAQRADNGLNITGGVGNRCAEKTCGGRSPKTASEVGQTAKGGGLGLAQGVANTANGVQDAGVGIANIVPAVWDNTSAVGDGQRLVR